MQSQDLFAILKDLFLPGLRTPPECLFKGAVGRLEAAMSAAVQVIAALDKNTAQIPVLEARDNLHRIVAHASDRAAVMCDMHGGMGPHFDLYARATLDALRQLIDHHTYITRTRFQLPSGSN